MHFLGLLELFPQAALEELLGAAPFLCVALLKKKFSSQIEWWWWGFQDIRGCSARRGHQEPKPIKQRKKLVSMNQALGNVWNRQVKQGLGSADKDSPPDTCKSFSRWLLLDRTPSLWHALPLLFILHIFQLKLWIWLRKIFSLLS